MESIHEGKLFIPLYDALKIHDDFVSLLCILITNHKIIQCPNKSFCDNQIRCFFDVSKVSPSTAAAPAHFRSTWLTRFAASGLPLAYTSLFGTSISHLFDYSSFSCVRGSSILTGFAPANKSPFPSRRTCSAVSLNGSVSSDGILPAQSPAYGTHVLRLPTSVE